MARNSNRPDMMSIDVDKIDVSAEFLDNLSEWTSFYRCYPFIFAEDFLGIKLEPFQKILLYQMFHNDFNMFCAARGLGKSWLLAVFSICFAELNPGSKIVISAGQKRMCMEVIGYIKAFYDESECLRRSISYLSDSINDAKVVWIGGSSFKIAIANDNARGARCHVLILDEHRTIKLDVINSVLRQFASDRRRPKFYNLPEWKDYPMIENKEIYASSTYYCHHWSYEKFKDYLNQMKKGKSYFLVDLPFQISVKSGLKSLEQIKNQMTEDTFDATKFDMEMCGRWIGQDSSAFFKHEILQACRKIKKPFYDDDTVNYIQSKNKKYLNMKKIKGNKDSDNEVRLLFCDIAMASGKENDNTVLGIMRLIPHSYKSGDIIRNYYVRDVIYIQTMNGCRIDYQAIQIRKMFDMFECDYCVLDGGGIGQTVFEELSKPITDNETGTEYSIPWTCINYDKWKERCTYQNAKPVIYAFIAGAKLNSDMHYEMLNCLTKKTINFIINEMDSKEIVASIGNISTIPTEYKAKIFQQYIQTDTLINEMINLKRIDKDGGIVKLEEASNAYKDRYMAVAMANYIASSEIEPLFLSTESTYDEDDDIVYLI